MVRFTMLFLLFSSHFCFAQFSENDFAKAARYFKEAKRAADKDKEDLWGKNLYGSMILVDPATKEAIANEPDSEGTFRPFNGVFTGKIPAVFSIANTAQSWGGKVWTVVIWPLPEDNYKRQNLLMHELYHQLQKESMLPQTDANCEHLDKSEGRLLIKLELEALKKALMAYPKSGQSDLQSAIAIRAYRYKKFPAADSLERLLEQNEGLAEYTGLLLSGRSKQEMIKRLLLSIDEFYNYPSFVRSVAYVTGPVYGFLLREKE